MKKSELIWTIVDLEGQKLLGIFTTKYRALQAMALFLRKEDGVTIDPPIAETKVFNTDGVFFQVDSSKGHFLFWLKQEVLDGGARLGEYV